MATATGATLDGNGDEAIRIPIVNPSDVSAARAAEFGSDSDDAGSRSGESRSERAKRAWETRRANGNAPAAKTDAKPKQAGATPRIALSVNSIEFALTGIHALLAAGMAAPELALQPAEATIVAQNIVAVARHYDLQASAKATDWGNLIVSLGVVYGPRVVALAVRKGNEAKTRGHGTPRVAPAPPQAPTPTQTPAPAAAGSNAPPATAKVPTRPSTREDDALLNEVEPAMF